MSKKDEQAEEAMKRMAEVKPSILKCSFNTGRKIKKQAPGAPFNVQSDLASMKIVMDDKIPDHIIFLCDKKGDILRMANLKVPESMLPNTGAQSTKTH